VWGLASQVSPCHRGCDAQEKNTKYQQWQTEMPAGASTHGIGAVGHAYNTHNGHRLCMTGAGWRGGEGKGGRRTGEGTDGWVQGGNRGNIVKQRGRW